jgi:hypothetical protein
MRIHLFIRRIGILTSLGLISWLPALATQSADQPLGGSPPIVLTGGPARMAAGGVEDTLKACLARIPKEGIVPVSACWLNKAANTTRGLGKWAKTHPSSERPSR